MSLKSDHQLKVEEFMRLAKQDLPGSPREPSEQVRLLRAKLIFEEAMELIRGLGVSVAVLPHKDSTYDFVINHATLIPKMGKIEFDVDFDFDMVETIDGCCDLKVVTTGTLSACGVPDMLFQNAVDDNNLAKFGPGHYVADGTPEKPGPVGKLIKPPGHKPPDIVGLLHQLPALLQA